MKIKVTRHSNIERFQKKCNDILKKFEEEKRFVIEIKYSTAANDSNNQEKVVFSAMFIHIGESEKRNHVLGSILNSD